MMRNVIVTVVSAFAILCGAQAGNATTTVYTSLAAFDAATTNQTTHNFNGILSCAAPCFQGFNPLNVGGVLFSTPNSGGNVNINSAFFYGPSDFPFAYVVSSVYSGGAPSVLNITLPGPATAFALDFGTFDSDPATFALSNGFGVTINPTAGFETTQFLGFVSNIPFNSLSMTVPPNEGQVVTDFITASAVPEPSTWAMMLLGFAGLGFAFRQSRRKVSFA